MVETPAGEMIARAIANLPSMQAGSRLRGGHRSIRRSVLPHTTRAAGGGGRPDSTATLSRNHQRASADILFSSAASTPGVLVRRTAPQPDPRAPLPKPALLGPWPHQGAASTMPEILPMSLPQTIPLMIAGRARDNRGRRSADHKPSSPSADLLLMCRPYRSLRHGENKGRPVWARRAGIGHHVIRVRQEGFHGCNRKISFRRASASDQRYTPSCPAP